jgi:YVTN family beta-propeller protein
MTTRITCLFIFATVMALYSCKRDPNYTGQDKFEWLAQAPADTLPAQINKTGKTIIPNGRIITPPGRTFQVAPHPYGLTLSPDGNTLVTANSGTSPLSITIIRNIYNEQPEIQQIPEGVETDEGILASVFMGLAIPPGNDMVYVGGGQTNQIFMFDLKTGNSLGSIDCSYKDQEVDYTDGYIGDLVLSKDGKFIYAVDQINFRMIIIDAVNRKLTASIPVGRYPFGICLSPDEKEAYVANVGMYEYKVIPGIDPDNYLETALEFPPFAYLSDESINGINTDTLKVPGLGDPNVPESFSVWTIDLINKKVTSKVKTGILVGEKIEDFPAVGGASPNSLAATDKYVFVSNGNNDCISVIDTKKDTVVNNIFLVPDKRLGRLRGVIPFGMALSPDHKRLYVAESGINAIGVIDIGSQEVVGHIPAGWFPSKLKVSSTGTKLFVANAKGYGSGPNGGSSFVMGPEGTYICGLMKGSVSVIDIPSKKQLKKYTKQVIENNFRFIRSDSKEFFARKTNPVPLYPGYGPSPIKHIVFVSKENRTYDEVFGQVKNGNGDPALARYGLQVTFTNRDKTNKLENVDVMPNHLALARKFSISDNFYVDSDVSADGHRWLACTYPNEWVETSVPAAYGDNQYMRLDSKSPGMLAFEGATGAIYPEDYNEAGSIWEHMERNNISFWNFGFGTMFAPNISDDPLFKNSGYLYAINYPVPAPIFAKTSRIYPTFNMAIPDQFRLDRFIKEFNEKWVNGIDTMPSVLTIIISQDHGAGERPDAGYPFRESYMADNDLALGRLVEFLSHTPYWKSTAIVVTEDDSQNGVDHIDAHRSILMVISPWAKKDYVGHSHISFGSIFKTFWNILGIPYLNQYDATTTDLSDMFTDTPDFSVYNAIPADKRIFDPEKAYDPLDVEFNWSALGESPILDHPDYLKKDSEVQDQRRLEEGKR